MTEVVCELNDGLTTKDDKTGKDKHHRTVMLQELTAGQLLDANRDSERVFDTEDGPVAIVSPSEAMRQMLRRQIKKIGDINGPLPVEVFNGLSAEDLKILDRHAKKLQKITSKEVGQAGRTDPQS